LPNLLGGDLSLVTGLLQAGDDFVPVERHARVVLLYDIELKTFAYLFVGGKTSFAHQALTASSYYPTGIA